MGGNAFNCSKTRKSKTRGNLRLFFDHERQLLLLSRGRTQGDGLPSAGPGDPGSFIGHKSSKQVGAAAIAPVGNWEETLII